MGTECSALRHVVIPVHWFSAVPMGGNQKGLPTSPRSLWAGGPDGTRYFPLESEMLAESTLLSFSRHVCPSKVLALPPTGFGCRGLFDQICSDPGAVWTEWLLQLDCSYLPVPRCTIHFPLGPGMWANVGRSGVLFYPAVSGLPTILGDQLSLSHVDPNQWSSGAC